MRPRSKKPPAPKVASRVQDTSQVARGFKQPPNHRAQVLARVTGLEVYDGVEAANQAGLPMPGQF